MYIVIIADLIVWFWAKITQNTKAKICSVIHIILRRCLLVYFHCWKHLHIWAHIIYPIQDTILNGACRQGSLLTKPHRVKILKVFLLWLQLCQNWRTLQTIWNKTNIPATIRAGETQECLLFVCLQSSSSSSPLFSGEFSEWFLLVPSCPILCLQWNIDTT